MIAGFGTSVGDSLCLCESTKLFWQHLSPLVRLYLCILDPIQCLWYVRDAPNVLNPWSEITGSPPRPTELKALGHTHVYNFCSKIYNFDRKQLQNLSRSAAIALKTSEIKRSQFFTSKLYSTFFFQLRKIFFWDRSKNVFLEKWFFTKKSKKEKSSLFSRLFFDRSQKIYFSELKKKVEYSFDVKIRDLSISEVFRAIPALLTILERCLMKKCLF